jgi:hypothetical protein
MPHVKDRDELWALALLQKIIERDRQDRDALPGSVMKHVKAAATIIKKRQQVKQRQAHRCG